MAVSEYEKFGENKVPGDGRAVCAPPAHPCFPNIKEDSGLSDYDISSSFAVSAGYKPVHLLDDSCLKNFDTGVVLFYESSWYECSVISIEPEVQGSPFSVTIYPDVSGPDDACSTLTRGTSRSGDDCFSEEYFRLPDSLNTNKWIIVIGSDVGVTIDMHAG
jgi:hypothetical protein